MGAYLNATKDLKLRISAEGTLKIQAYVDASYGVHIDGKSHTGITDPLGEESFTNTSTKQMIVTKSSSGRVSWNFGSFKPINREQVFLGTPRLQSRSN